MFTMSQSIISKIWAIVDTVSVKFLKKPVRIPKQYENISYRMTSLLIHQSLGKSFQNWILLKPPYINGCKKTKNTGGNSPYCPAGLWTPCGGTWVYQKLQYRPALYKKVPFHIDTEGESGTGLGFGSRTSGFRRSRFLRNRKALSQKIPYRVISLQQWRLQVFGGETAECVCQGLQDIFEFIGGAPLLLIFDSATGVGRRTGDAVHESKLFSRFRAHYHFRIRFCNPLFRLGKRECRTQGRW